MKSCTLRHVGRPAADATQQCHAGSCLEIEQVKVNETAAANDEISKKDAEIRKLIEERRNTSNKEAKSSHPVRELPMFLVNSTAKCLTTNKVKRLS